MFRYAARRTVGMIPLLLVISLLQFGIFQLMPGDPVMAFIPLESMQSPAEVERIRAALGLDKPWTVRYVRWMGLVLKGDLGRSIVNGDTVVEKIARALPVTLKLTILSFMVSFGLAVIVGVVGAVRHNSLVDHLSAFFSFIGLCIPSFWLGLMLMLLFALKLRWLPATGMGPIGEANPGLLTQMKYLVMPVLVLSLDSIAGWSRYIRSSLLEVVHQDYIRTARAKGLSDRIVFYRHALRNALIPVVTFLGLGLAGFFGGALVVENLFAWPGMGRILVDAIFKKDYPVIMGINMMFAFLTVLGSLLADLFYGVADPRVKYS